MARLQAKICGLSTPEAVAAAVEGGAAYVGFVFFPPSPRSVSPERVSDLAAEVRPGVCKVGLFVDPDDALLDETLARAPLDMIQLHGKESPERVLQVRELTGLR